MRTKNDTRPIRPFRNHEYSADPYVFLYDNPYELAIVRNCRREWLLDVEEDLSVPFYRNRLSCVLSLVYCLRA